VKKNKYIKLNCAHLIVGIVYSPSISDIQNIYSCLRLMSHEYSVLSTVAYKRVAYVFYCNQFLICFEIVFAIIRLKRSLSYGPLCINIQKIFLFFVISTFLDIDRSVYVHNVFCKNAIMM